ncbi:MAG: hypothetical protein AB7V16_07555 [Vulcanibacillus sp.]
MDCLRAIYLMHDYFDGDIEEQSFKELTKHINNCLACNVHYNELKNTNLILMQLPTENVSTDLSDNILIKCAKKERVKKLASRYPVVFAASIFLLLFSVSLISYTVPGNDFKLVSENYQNLIIKGNEVIVPEGKEICGDIIIENGNLQIIGEVKGNVTVVNGEIFMASASQVDGTTNQVDLIFERIWYQLKNIWANF